MADRLRALADAHGILPAFTDVTGERRETGDESRRALLAAMGIDLSAPSAMDAALSEADPAQRRLPRWQVLRPGQGANLPLADDSEWRILREDGRSHEGRGPALPGLPLGRHRLTAEGETCWLLCAPAAAAAVLGTDRAAGGPAHRRAGRHRRLRRPRAAGDRCRTAWRGLSRHQSGTCGLPDRSRRLQPLHAVAPQAPVGDPHPRRAQPQPRRAHRLCRRHPGTDRGIGDGVSPRRRADC